MDWASQKGHSYGAGMRLTSKALCKHTQTSVNSGPGAWLGRVALVALGKAVPGI